MSKRWRALLGVVAVLAALGGARPGPARAADETYLVRLRERAPLGTAQGNPPAAKRALLATARRAQAPLLARLEHWRRAGKVRAYQPLWIINAISVRADDDVLRALRQHPAVAAVTPSLPVRVAPTRRTRVAALADTHAWNLRRIAAPLVWTEYGTRGDGIRIGVLDTGVDPTHPALAGGKVVAWNDFVDPTNTTPLDPHGHGTMVCGTLVGGNAGGTAIGVAPDAHLIVARMLDVAGNGGTAETLAAMQWVMDPDGDPNTDDGAEVVNCSWGGPSNSPVMNAGFRDAIDAWRAAGIFAAFAVGNNGPAPRSTYSPGDYPNAFSVGAVDRADVVASMSSRGPTTWSGWGDIAKPDVSAPGEQVLTAGPGGYVLGTGSSHACPHVTGTAALILAAARAVGLRPTVDQIATALKRTATDLGAPGTDNDYGVGLVNAREAVRFLVGDRDVSTPVTLRGLGTFAVSLRAPVSRRALGLAQVPMKRWDAATQTYAEAADTLTPGEGYWALAETATAAVVSGRAQGEAARIALQPGWNLISSPFLQPVAWDLDQIQVQPAGQAPRPLGQAGALIHSYAWGWRQDEANFRQGSYVLIYDSAVLPGVAHELAPWEGYWVKAKSACSLILPVPGRNAVSRARRGTARGWSLRIQAQDRHASRSVVIGALSSQGLAVPPPPEPPASHGRLSVGLERAGMPLGVDVRAGGAGRWEWGLRVSTADPADTVTLTWPDLRAVPAEITLTLEDTATGRRRLLRNTPGYTFQAAAAVRRFRLIAEPQVTAPVRITHLQVVTLRSGARALRFVLSSPAAVDVAVLTPTGRVLAVLAQGRAMTAGTNQVIWMGAVRPGIYLVRVTATTEDGRVFQALAPGVVAR